MIAHMSAVVLAFVATSPRPPSILRIHGVVATATYANRGAAVPSDGGDDGEPSTIKLVTLQCPPEFSATEISDSLMEAGALYVSVSDSNRGTPSEQPRFSWPTHPAQTAGLPLPCQTSQTRRVGMSCCVHEGCGQTRRSRSALRRARTSRRPSTAAWSQTLDSRCRPLHDRRARSDGLGDGGPEQLAAHCPERVPHDPLPVAHGRRGDGGDARSRLWRALAPPQPWHRLWYRRACDNTALLCSPPPPADTFRLVAGCAVLDYGSGSGVLSFAALLFGAGSALGVDIDVEALATSRVNAAMNGFNEKQFVAVEPDEEQVSHGDSKYPIVVANILAGTQSSCRV